MAEVLVAMLWLAVGCAVPCAALGTFLVVRRMSLLGDAISHAVLPGIALGFFWTRELGSWSLVVGAAAFGVLTAVMSQWLHRRVRLPEDVSLGVVFTALFALGVALITYASRRWHVDLDPGCVLYGQLELSTVHAETVLGWKIPRAFVETLLPLNVLVLVGTVLFWKELQLVSFDVEQAEILGYRPGWVNQGLLVAVAVVCVAVFREVGSILVLALLIVPAATALLLAKRLSSVVMMAVGIGVIGACLGCLLAVRYNWNTAGSIAMALGGLFAAALLLAPRQGIVAQVVRRVALRWRIVCEDVLAFCYRIEEAAQKGRLPRGTIGNTDLRRLLGRFWPVVLWYLRLKGDLMPAAPGYWQLSESGRTRARLIVRSHRLWETWLQRHFPLPADHLHAIAERMEHFLTPELQAELAAELGETHDPHGREIPPA
jgi:manganese/zinc/iron transport system permease protein